jgi:hypothetical protein
MRHPDNIDAWNPTTDEGQQPPVPPKTTSGSIPTPVINLVQAKPKGESVYIRVVVLDPVDASLTPVVRYRVADDGSGIPGAWVEQKFENYTVSTLYINLSTQTVPVDQLLDIQAAFVASDGDYGSWSVTSNVTSTVDPVAPAALLSFTNTDAAPHLGVAKFALTTGTDSHLKKVSIYRKASGAALNVASDTPIATLNVGSLGTYSFTDGDDTRTNLISNGAFDTDTVWSKGSGWTIASGKATKAAGTTASIQQTVADLPGNIGAKYRYRFRILDWAAGTAAVRLLNGTLVTGASFGANGLFAGSLVSVSGNTAFGIAGTSTFAGAIDDAILIRESLSSAPQGDWDYYAVPFNGSNLPGPASGPIAVSVV